MSIGYVEELGPSLKLTSIAVFINAYASPHYAADLNVVIEGPQDARFRAYRKATEDDTESEYDEPKEDPDQPLYGDGGWRSHDLGGRKIR